MKTTLIGLFVVLSLVLVPGDAMSQQRRGNRGVGQGQGNRGAHGQSQLGNRGQNRGQGQSISRNQGHPATQNLLVSGSSTPLFGMWEEEKLAHDVYVSLAKTTGMPIFRNISSAESQHMQAIARLMGPRGGNMGGADNAAGVFVSPEYQKLYATLVAAGSRSPLDAMMVGAKIEEMDIADLRKMLAQTTDQQARQTLERLLQGSYNHLRAFASQIGKLDGTYNAEFLTQAEFDEIANSSGRGNGSQGNGPQGAGGGRGRNGRGAQMGGSNGQAFGMQGNRGQGRGSQGRGANGQGSNGQGSNGQGFGKRGRR